MASEDFWSATITAFQPLITSPALTEKLLQRPPFRFIFDIVVSINQRFLAYDHLFTAEEQDVAQMDTKEKKIAYLEKLINFVALMLGRPIDVSAKKIVAGLEPEKTNAFLRDVALAVGYAQQYKQQQQQQVAPPPPPPVEDTPPPPPPPPPSSDSRKPVLQIDSHTRVNPEKDKVLKEATEFVQKVSKLGIDFSDTPGLKIGEAIRNMERELKQRDLPPTEPSPMPEATLEIAIKRQLDSLAQIKHMIDENNVVTSKLIEAAMSTF